MICVNEFRKLIGNNDLLRKDRDVREFKKLKRVGRKKQRNVKMKCQVP